ncbi:hypothetical protein KAT51_04145 [bacterium]|nr:hypothetical protein [bacterium]
MGLSKNFDPTDLVGYEHGHIKVIKYVGQCLAKYTGRPGRMKYLYEVKCHNCGHNFITERKNLKIGIKSCGCIGHNNIKIFNPNRDKYKDSPTYANMLRLYGSYKRHAEARNLIWDLNIHEFHVLTKKDCYYCGKPPMQIRKHGKNESRTKYYYYNGIDRKDNKKGYISENVVSCCFQCNHAKMGLNDNEFIKMASKIYVYQNRLEVTL